MRLQFLPSTYPSPNSDVKDEARSFNTTDRQTGHGWRYGECASHADT